ncbi:MAG TPA: hypothetical protein VM533_11745 [Fimbriiglobus sp.]|nr:hypothetical protein [Fimbriiglobus sp.]
MFPRLLLVLSAGAALAAPAPALAQPPGDEIGRLVAQLDADDFRVRDRAARRLREVGLDTLPRLRRAAEESQSVEVRTRLADLIAGITRPGWRSDLAAVRAEALRTGKPILVVSTVGLPTGFG